MPIRRASKTPGRLAGWLGWAGLDAIGRLALLTGSTIVFSRLLTPQEFGIAALVLALVAVGAVCVGAPFEEALVQKRGARIAHFSTALFVSLAAGVALVAMSVLAAPFLARAYDAPTVRWLLPVAMVSILFGGYADLLNALARRLLRFNDSAFANLASHAVGIALALGLAFAGHGLWALVGQRIFVVLARAVILHARLGVGIVPRWSAIHLSEISSYARVSFVARLTDSLTYLAFNNVVQALFGTTVLGHVNMAMRLIEPLRGAVVATGHNLALSALARARGAPDHLNRARQEIVSLAALAIAPVFTGLAAIMPILLPFMAGRGWEAAVPVATLLALGCALSVPAQLVFTAFSANGRPGLNLTALLAGFAATLSGLIVATPLGAAGVGAARMAGDGVRTGLALIFGDPSGTWPRRARLSALLPAWLLSTAMGLAVWGLVSWVAGWPPLTGLLALVVAGCLVYGLLLRLFVPMQLAALVRLVRPAR